MCAELSPTESTPMTIVSPERLCFPAAPISLMKSRNFEFLRENHRELADLGGFAEAYVHSDPAACLVKLRTFAEFLLKALFAHHRFELTYQSNLNDLLADTPSSRSLRPLCRTSSTSSASRETTPPTARCISQRRPR